MKSEISETGQYLTFYLDGEVYAIQIQQVREVLDLPKITKVPHMPEFMRGVINLRGGVVPVVDLRVKFDMNVVEDTVNTCIIILELEIDGDSAVFGAIGDSVKEVVTIEPASIEAAPKMGNRLNTEFIKGMSRRDDDFLIILDIAKIFTEEELEAVTAQQGSETSEELVEELTE